MKKVYILFTLLLSVSLLSAQNKVPDFKLKDINGKEHHLYSYLEEGKAVLLDFTTTWCGPCWGIHLLETIKKYDEAYGPNGTNQLQVLFIESDVTTTMADLEGTGSKTLGNWIKGTNYPIIDIQKEDESLITEKYKVSSFPTILLIHPEKATASPNLYPNSLSLESFSTLMKNTVTPRDGADIVVHSLDIPDHACGSVDGSFNAANGTKNIFKNPEFDLYVNGELKQSIEYLGEIVPTSSSRIIFKNLALDEGANQITIKYSGEDDNAENNATTKTASELKIDNTIKISVTTDEFSADDKARITVKDKNGEIIHNSGILPGSKKYEATINLPADGCYSIHAYDDFGDGFGEVHITDGSNNLIYKGYTLKKEFYLGVHSLKSLSTTVEELNNYTLLPNPASDMIRLTISLKNNISGRFTISDCMGREVYTSASKELQTSHVELFDITSLTTGVYFIHLYSDQQMSTFRFVKSR